MEPADRLVMVSKIMLTFAQRTALDSPGTKARRYLWTDAFGVCNFLELNRQTGKQHFEELALGLAEQVHHVLGRYGENDSRKGWISGLDDEEGEKHPTKGGLRIGKPLPERRTDEPSNERLEWERDGQYFHYLTKWMVALNRIFEHTGDDRFLRWALELCRTAHAAFTYEPPIGGNRLMYWKMSIDLSRPLVDSMGQHDPLDGLLTYLELQEAAEACKFGKEKILETEIAEMAAMCKGRDWTTDDSLGLGGILGDALRVARLVEKGRSNLEALFYALLNAAAVGLSFFAASGVLRHPAEYRLAFRELGLSIGLHAAQKIEAILVDNPAAFAAYERIENRLEDILLYKPLCKMIEVFWLKAENQKTATWKEHEDINSVMLATSLLPDSFLART